MAIVHSDQLAVEADEDWDDPAAPAELLDSIRPVGPWTARAACRGLDPELFYIERGEPTRDAKAVCRGCVVRQDCLEYALDAPERIGIWGGLSEKSRRKERARRRAAARAGAA